jgi:GxxExxY protein
MNCLAVLSTLGAGFLEKVHENALVHEVRKAGLGVVQQYSVPVTDDGAVVGQYGVVLVELKSVRALDEGASGPMRQLLKGTSGNNRVG